ncbi:MAG: hypothetical protein L0387_44140 [Acidobacteria bacterium]|nr:hypothetical protein [Acidobacteriota bacterium]
MMQLNLAYQQHLSCRVRIGDVDGDAIRERQRQAERLHAFWSSIRCAQLEGCSAVWRRQSLQRALENLGRDNYYAGQIPPAAPVWGFEVIDEGR